MGDLFDDLYRPRATRYGDDIDTEHTADALPDRHGFRYQIATGCTCHVCALGCRNAKERQRAHESKPRPWDRTGDITPAMTLDEYKAARSA